MALPFAWIIGVPGYIGTGVLGLVLVMEDEPSELSHNIIGDRVIFMT